jgi:polysaccharide export outer membrane protein
MGVQPIGYEVDSIGRIELPIVGSLNVAGLSCPEAADTIRKQLNKYLKHPTTNVRILNHRFTILGKLQNLRLIILSIII